MLAIYKNDLSRLELEAQLPLLKPLCKDLCEELAGNFSVHDAVGILSKLSAAERTAFSGVWIALKLLLVLPATNATSEWSFSALRRVKTYMRSTMNGLTIRWFYMSTRNIVTDLSLKELPMSLSQAGNAG